MSLPRTDRAPGSLSPDGYLALTREEVDELRRHGDAVALANDGVVAQHHASDYPSLNRIIDAYRTIGEAFGAQLFVRGQRRAYFDDDGPVVITPTADRPSASGTPFNQFTNPTAIEEQLGPWMNVLSNELGVELGDCLKYMPLDADFGLLRFCEPSVFTGRTSSIVLEAILQHYGFPTNALDVTTSVPVAAWFALHQAAKRPTGEIGFDAYHPPDKGTAESTSLADVPLIFLYLQFPGDKQWPVVNLTAYEELTRVAVRPIAQSAFTLSSRHLHFSQPQDAVWTVEDRRDRFPAALVRLHFGAAELERHHPELTQDELLPVTDPLYLRLLEVNAPGLANYGRPSGDSSVSPSDTKSPARPPTSARAIAQLRPSPLPGSVVENPRVKEVWKQATDLLTRSGFRIEGTSMSSRDVVFSIHDRQRMSAETKAKLHELGSWGGVVIYVNEAGADDSG